MSLILKRVRLPILNTAAVQVNRSSPIALVFRYKSTLADTNQCRLRSSILSNKVLIHFNYSELAFVTHFKTR